MSKKKAVDYKIPLEGSLSLLALGAVGLKAWRKRLEEENKSSNKTPNDKEED